MCDDDLQMGSFPSNFSASPPIGGKREVTANRRQRGEYPLLQPMATKPTERFPCGEISEILSSPWYGFTGEGQQVPSELENRIFLGELRWLTQQIELKATCLENGMSTRSASIATSVAPLLPITSGPMRTRAIPMSSSSPRLLKRSS